MSGFIVLLDDEVRRFAYGPFTDPIQAQQFAQFLTREVDPAAVIPLISPADELLGWWRSQCAGETKPMAAEGTWPPILGDIWQDQRCHRWVAMPGNQLLHLLGGSGSAPHEEIWRLFGPLDLVHRPEPIETEVPF